MNIESVNLMPVLPATSEGYAQSLPESGTGIEDFTNTLLGQLELLTESKVPTEKSEQAQSIAVEQNRLTMDDMDELLSKNIEEELVALLNQYSPTAPKNNAANDDDGETTSLPLTDTLSAITPSTNSMDLGAMQQNSDEPVKLQDSPDVRPQPLPIANKLSLLRGENIVSADFLRKEMVSSLPKQEGQDFSLRPLENTNAAEKTLPVEKTPPGIAVELPSFPMQIDNRIDTPAITRPIAHPGWSQDLGEHILWMNSKAIPAAEIKLNPAHLGPISVRIDVNQDQASIAITAHHAEVKEAIEASLPKLREMLGTQQLNLVNIDISHGSTSDHGRPQSQTFSKTAENFNHNSEGVNHTIEKSEHERALASKGILSLYA
jgi:flagellar hook-length control protein FliK